MPGCFIQAMRLSVMPPASDCVRSRSLPNWEVVISWPCVTWKSAALATCSVLSKAARWKPLASISTWKCCRNPWLRSRVKTFQRSMTPRWTFRSPPSFQPIGSPMPTKKMGAYRSAGECQSAEALVELAAELGRSLRSTAWPCAVAAAVDGTEVARKTLWLRPDPAREAEHRSGDTDGRAGIPFAAAGITLTPAWPLGLSGREREHSEGAGARPRRVADGQTAGGIENLAVPNGSSNPWGMVSPTRSVRIKTSNATRPFSAFNTAEMRTNRHSAQFFVTVV